MLTYRNQSIDFQSKTMYWFLYDPSVIKELNEIQHYAKPCVATWISLDLPNF